MDTKSVFSGLFMGIILGGASTLLSTPVSGYETRNFVKQYDLKTLNNKLARTGKSAIQNWQETATEGFDAVDGLTKEMKKTYSRYKDEVEPEVEAIQQQVKEISDSITELNERIRKESK